MQRVSAPLSHHLHLAARATIEVSGLVRRRNLEFLNAGYRDGNDSRRRLVKTRAVIGPRSTAGVATETRNVSVVVAAHVVCGIPAVELERVLVAGGTAYVPVDVLTGLQNRQGRGVPAGVRQVD